MMTIFEEEIRSQGAILGRRSSSGMEQAERVAAAWSGIDYALVAARGSSDHGALFFQYLAGQELGLLVALAAPSLFEGPVPIGLSGAGVLTISQSGRSPGLIQVLEQAQLQHRPSATITNDVTSPLAEKSQLLIDLAVGPERAIASTKTFSATWHAAAQLVCALKGRELAGLSDLPEMVDRVAGWALSAPLPTEKLNGERGLTVVGRGVGYSVAAEIALKIREVTGIRSESYAAADYVHGPIGADGAESALLLVVTEELSDALCREVLSACHDKGMRTVVLRPPERDTFESDEEIVLPESTSNWALGLGEVVVGQVLALRLGELRHRPIDTSPGLNKVTLSA